MGEVQMVFCPNCQAATYPDQSRQECLLTLDSGVSFYVRTCPVCACLFQLESNADGSVFHTEIGGQIEAVIRTSGTLDRIVVTS